MVAYGLLHMSRVIAMTSGAVHCTVGNVGIHEVQTQYQTGNFEKKYIPSWEFYLGPIALPVQTEPERGKKKKEL